MGEDANGECFAWRKGECKRTRCRFNHACATCGASDHHSGVAVQERQKGSVTTQWAGIASQPTVQSVVEVDEKEPSALAPHEVLGFLVRSSWEAKGWWWYHLRCRLVDAPCRRQFQRTVQTLLGCIARWNKLSFLHWMMWPNSCPGARSCHGKLFPLMWPRRTTKFGTRIIIVCSNR